jgi:lipopolysaccharide assembly outer membrane protein LptD (OstA)
MRKIFVLSLVLIAADFNKFENYAQCSDAGICQIGGHSMGEDDEVLLNVSAFYKYGYSGKEDDVQFNSLQLNINYNLFSNSSIQLLVPYNFQSGPAGSVNGIGDLILSLNQNLLTDKGSSLDASIGIKMATGDDNKDSLPQVYQSGLGKNDVLFALNYTYNKIGFGAGYQLSGGRNNNITRLEKGDDLLLRASYNLSFELLSITPQLLYIQPLAKSGILDTASAGEEKFVEVDKSDQPQLNFLAVLRYKINDYFTLVGDFAIPFIKREVNVDGLTRAFSAAVGVSFSIY